MKNNILQFSIVLLKYQTLLFEVGYTSSQSLRQN